MTTSKHTPGPWKILENRPDMVFGNGYAVCRCQPDYRALPSDHEEQIIHANARLIAAAPGLLYETQCDQNLSDRIDDALKWLFENYQQIPEGHSIEQWINNLKIINDARRNKRNLCIAKATGAA